MKTLAVAALAALASTANAECANACSGKGECGANDQCICYDGYFGSDCSLRMCPHALAFVDVPNGDLNHDGSLATGVSGYSKVSWARFPVAEKWPAAAGTITLDTNTDPSENKGIASIANGGGYAAAKGEAHWYTECSGKGMCDRATGECACYDGYTGAACQRTTCPNDCSGHGRCKQVGEIAAGALNKKFVDSVAGVNSFSGVTEAFEYRLYDGEKNSACVCDLGYSGVDCSLRECPRGDDPLTNIAATCGGKACNNEIQGFSLSSNTPAGAQYQIEFQDVNGNKWLSPSFAVDINTASAAALTSDQMKAAAKNVEAAIEGLPNTLVGNVTVSASADFTDNTGTGYRHVRFLVTFDSMSGNINEFTVNKYSANALAPLVQPNEPVQLANVATLTGTVSGYINPDDVTSLRDTQLKATAGSAGATVALLKAALASQVATNQLGSSPVDVLSSGTNVMVIFKENKNRPGMAKKLGKNPIRLSDGTNTVIAKPDARDGNTEYSVCSNRGVCDYSSGLCACFGGYTGAACDTQSALAM